MGTRSSGPGQREYSTLNLPPASVIRSTLGAEACDRVIAIEQLGKGLSRKITRSSAEVDGALAQVRAGYERWTARFRQYVESAACETLLSDYSPTRMAGLLNGMTGECVGLSTYFLGTLVEREIFHGNPALWQPLVDCARDVVFDLKDIQAGVLKALSKRHGKGALADALQGDVALLEAHKDGDRILKNLETLFDRLYKNGMEQGLIQEVCNRPEVERLLLVAEEGIKHIEEQGGVVMRHGGSMASSLGGQGKVVALERGTLDLIELAGERINRKRSTMGLVKLTREDQVIHEVVRHSLAFGDHPYVPSPFLEGRYVSSAHGKSKLEQDLAAIAEESDISFRTLQGYVDSGQTIAAWAARSLALAWKAAQRLQTNYRYDIVEVKGQAVRGGEKGYLFVARGHAQAVPKGALAAAQVDELLAKKGRGGGSSPAPAAVEGKSAPTKKPVHPKKAVTVKKPAARTAPAVKASAKKAQPKRKTAPAPKKAISARKSGGSKGTPGRGAR